MLSVLLELGIGTRNRCFMQVWIVGQVLETNDWSFHGVFTTEAKAIKQCRNERWFIAPAIIDDDSIPPDGVGMWPGAYFPITKTNATT